MKPFSSEASLPGQVSKSLFCEGVKSQKFINTTITIKKKTKIYFLSDRTIATPSCTSRLFYQRRKLIGQLPQVKPALLLASMLTSSAPHCLQPAGPPNP